jgi:hypothetical protein
LCDTPCCLQDTIPALCSWYHTYTNHALACGYFVVPYELLSQGHGPRNGFEFDVDIPKNKRMSYFNWKNDFGCVFHKSGMFPRDSHFAQHVESTNNGLIALLALLTDTCPVFVDQPIMLAMNWPVQSGTKMIFSFYMKFLDHIHLHAIFMGAANSMVSTTMIDCLSITANTWPTCFKYCNSTVKIPSRKVFLPQSLLPSLSTTTYPSLTVQPTSNWIVLAQERYR